MDQDGFYYVSGRTAPPDLFGCCLSLHWALRGFVWIAGRSVRAARFGAVQLPAASAVGLTDADGPCLIPMPTSKSSENSAFFRKIPAKCFILSFLSTPRNCFNSRTLWFHIILSMPRSNMLSATLFIIFVKFCWKKWNVLLAQIERHRKWVLKKYIIIIIIFIIQKYILLISL